MYTYNPNDKWDEAVYKGPFAKFKVLYQGANYLAEHRYEVTKDLKMPTKKERQVALKTVVLESYKKR